MGGGDGLWRVGYDHGHCVFILYCPAIVVPWLPQRVGRTVRYLSELGEGVDLP